MRAPIEYIDILLANFIDYLKQNHPQVHQEYPNMLVELGYETVMGSDEVYSFIQEQLESLIHNLPSTLRDWLWWRMPEGLVEEERIYEIMFSPTHNFSTLNKKKFEQFDVLRNAFEDRLRFLAEEAYDRWINPKTDEELKEESAKALADYINGTGPRPADFGKNNKLVTEDMYLRSLDKLRRALAEKKAEEHQ